MCGAYSLLDAHYCVLGARDRFSVWWLCTRMHYDPMSLSVIFTQEGEEEDDDG